MTQLTEEQKIVLHKSPDQVIETIRNYWYDKFNILPEIQVPKFECPDCTPSPDRGYRVFTSSTVGISKDSKIRIKINAGTENKEGTTVVKLTPPNPSSEIAQNRFKRFVQHMKKLEGEYSKKGKRSDSEKEEYRFEVALSFPGEKRDLIKKIADQLSDDLTEENILYDKYHEAEFARPNLDIHLQDLYRNQSKLLVVFLGSDYERKEWPGLEWRAIRDLIKKREDEKILLFRSENADISGIFGIDGYLDICDRSPNELADKIIERLRILDKTD